MREALRKTLLDQAAPGEEFFVLMPANWRVQNKLQIFLEEITYLTNQGFLDCWKGSNRKQQITITELQEYIKIRLGNLEDPKDIPTDWDFEYYWKTTPKGWALFRKYEAEGVPYISLEDETV